MMRLLVVFLSTLVLSSGALAQTAIKFALDWRFEGPAAPYFVAIDQGYYADEGLDVSIDPGSGSVEGINRVASGAYQLGFADINSMVKFRDNPANAPLQAVQMVYDTPAFAIITMKRTGISGPKDLEGKILGAPAPDGAYAQWPIFVAANGIEASKVKIENVGFPVREPMLVKGDVDAITGFWFSSYMNLKANGAKDDDIVVMLMKDYGVDLYGNVIIVNPEFAKSNPDAVKGFVKATIRGIQETIRNPEAAIDALLKRNQIANKAVELERLKLALDRNFVTDATRQNGFGDVDMSRLARSIDQIGLTFKYTNKPSADAIFTSAFLPPKADRLVP
jgi:NitT/TauT family transport system substrate-binding protein